MCLDRLKVLNCPNKGVGYKVLEEFGEILRTPLNPVLLPFNTNMVAVMTDIWTDDEEPYKSGYHIFLNLEDAKEYLEEFFGDTEAVFEVEYENVLAEGVQNGCDCITTEIMKVVKQVYNGGDYVPSSERFQEYKWEDRDQYDVEDFEYFDDDFDDDDFDDDFDEDDDWYEDDEDEDEEMEE